MNKFEDKCRFAQKFWTIQRKIWGKNDFWVMRWNFSILVSSPNTYSESQVKPPDECLKIFKMTHFKQNFMPVVSFYTPWKRPKTSGFYYVFKRYKKRPVAWNGISTPVIITAKSLCFLGMQGWKKNAIRCLSIDFDDRYPYNFLSFIVSKHIYINWVCLITINIKVK